MGVLFTGLLALGILFTGLVDLVDLLVLCVVDSSSLTSTDALTCAGVCLTGRVLGGGRITSLSWVLLSCEESASTIPRLVLFARALSCNIFRACGINSWLKISTSCAFFAFDGYSTLCVTSIERIRGIVREEGSNPGWR